MSSEAERARLVGARAWRGESEWRLVLRRLHDGQVRADPLHRFWVGVQAVFNDLDRACYFERRFFNEHPSNHRVSFLRRQHSPGRFVVPPTSRPFLPNILGILLRKTAESDIARSPCSNN